MPTQKIRTKMLNSEQNPEVCDATADASSTIARQIIPSQIFTFADLKLFKIINDIKSPSGDIGV